MMKKVISLFFAVLTATGFYATLCQAEEAGYSAIVFDISGEAYALGKGEKAEKRTLQAGDLLYAGDTVETKDKASITITYFLNGRQEKWPSGVKFLVGSNETANVPQGVEVSSAETTTPDGLFSGHEGAYELKSLFPNDLSSDPLPSNPFPKDEENKSVLAPK